MADRLLETKLYAPRRRDGLIPRPRLDERLSRGLGSKLTLISAPAGFGKTTLTAQQLGDRADRPATAWLSLDAADNEPASFWTYVIAALQTAAPGVGADARLLLDAPGARVEGVLVSLLNDLRTMSTDVALVLDDYHVIEAPEIHDGMAFLLEHLPAGIHVVIATRADPPLPLARLRARRELVEIRAGDLRFTADEAAAYLGGPMGLTLTDHDVDTLERRTEGWIAALQLAGLSLQGRADTTGFIDGFAGDDRYIVDYLVEEVLQRQSPDRRRFLLQTSILSRLNGPLCDAVTGTDGGRAMLDALDRGNLFLVPLDDRRQWYRYHHLFADVLRAHLLGESPDAARGLHRRAAEWFEQNGERSAAIVHAMAGHDFERAADLIELAVPDMNRQRREWELRRWMEALPQELFLVRPMLALAHAGALMSTGEIAGVDGRLQEAEWWLDPPAAAGGHADGTRPTMVVVDPSEVAHLPSVSAMLRAGQARMLGDAAGTIAHAQRALDLASEDDHLRRGGAAALLGLASWSSGDLDAAQRWYADGMASLHRAGHHADVVGGAVMLADLQIAQGRLGDALRTYERGLRLAEGDGGATLRGAADMHVGMAELARERNDLEAASLHLAASRALGDDNGMPQNAHRLRVVAARIRQAEGDPDGALELLDEAELRYVSDFAPEVRPISSLKARVWIAQGRLPEALGWARLRGVTAADELSYLREFDHATLARLLVAQGTRDRADERIAEATDLTERLLQAAEHGQRTGAAIDILVVQALARHARDDEPGALSSLTNAVALAEAEGYMRVFLDEGPPMAALLKLAARQRGAPAFVRRLLTAFVTADPGAGTAQPLIEPLTERELEVLRLLASELDGPDVARELNVSVNTVRTHTRNVYAKLGVNTRRAAVGRATELGLLTRPLDRRTR